MDAVQTRLFDDRNDLADICFIYATFIVLELRSPYIFRTKLLTQSLYGITTTVTIDNHEAISLVKHFSNYFDSSINRRS